MTSGIVYSFISLCFGIMFICSKYKYISYKLTKKSSLLKCVAGVDESVVYRGEKLQFDKNRSRNMAITSGLP